MLKRSLELAESGRASHRPFEVIARNAALAMIEARLAWLDRLFEAVLAEARSERRSARSEKSAQA